MTTNHNVFLAQVQSIWDAYPWAHHALSRASAATFPSRGALPPIHHGIDVDSFTFGERPEGYLLFLGRFSPEKGAARAIAAARAPGAGSSWPARSTAADADHFAAEIEPQIDDDQIRYVGEADCDRKRGSSREPTPSCFRSTGTSRSASS